MYMRRELVAYNDRAGFVERRGMIRICNPFPAVVEGVDVNGDEFKIATVLDNLSREGLYLRIAPDVCVGSHLSVVFRFSGSVESGVSAPRVSISGEVLRVDKMEGGACGVAVGFKPVKFM